jgi:hypothetical protein
MKRKKFVSAAIALGVSALMLTMTAFASTQGIQSYERFKQAALNLSEEENITASGKFKLYVDGDEIGGGGFEMKAESASRTTTKMTLGDNDEVGMVMESDDEQIRSIYMLPDGSYMRQVIANLDEYAYDRAASRSEPMSETEKRLASSLIDIATGDLKTYFTMDENRVSFNLSENQIPEVFQLLLAVASEHADMNDMEDEGYSVEEGETFFVQITDGEGGHTISYERPEIGADPETMAMFEQIVEDLDNSMTDLSAESFGMIRNNTACDSIAFDGTLNDAGQIETVQGSMVLTGEDESGISHEVKLYVEVAVSDIGTTVCDYIDLEGKNVVDLPEMSHYDASGWINTTINE